MQKIRIGEIDRTEHNAVSHLLGHAHGGWVMSAYSCDTPILGEWCQLISGTCPCWVSDVSLSLGYIHAGLLMWTISLGHTHAGLEIASQTRDVWEPFTSDSHTASHDWQDALSMNSVHSGWVMCRYESPSRYVWPPSGTLILWPWCDPANLEGWFLWVPCTTVVFVTSPATPGQT